MKQTMSKVRTGLVAAVSAGLGMAVAYLLDPDRGRARRAQMRDQLGAGVRHGRRRAARRARYGLGELKGFARKATGAGRQHPQDDLDVVQGIRQRFARLRFPTTDVMVDVVDGTATLRGQVDEADQVGTVQSEVMKAPGVRAVKSFLHLPGQPAPNKAAAMHAVSS